MLDYAGNLKLLEAVYGAGAIPVEELIRLNESYKFALESLAVEAGILGADVFPELVEAIKFQSGEILDWQTLIDQGTESLREQKSAIEEHIAGMEHSIEVMGRVTAKYREALGFITPEQQESLDALQRWFDNLSDPQKFQLLTETDIAEVLGLEGWLEFIDRFKSVIDGLTGIFSGAEEKEVKRSAKSLQDNLEDSLVNGILNVARSIASGDIGRAIQSMFNSFGEIIGAHFENMISKQAGGGLGGSLLGALGGGLVGAGISLLGGLFGGGNKGKSADDPVFVSAYISNWEQFFQFGTTLPVSFALSGRGGAAGFDPHGRVTDMYETGRRNRTFFDT
jgi:hypothetical protein